MNYYDDILNVNAYLRSRAKKSIADMQQLVADFGQERKEYDKLLSRTDALLAKAKALAEQAGVEVPAAVVQSKPLESCEQLLVEIPDDYDFAKAFEKLRQEAHAAGFTNVHPEELLTAEELRHAEAFERELDERFMLETSLRRKDMAILAAAVALRIACFFLFSAPIPQEESKVLPAAESVGKNHPNAQSVPSLTDAMQGVNLNTLLSNTESFSRTFSKGGGLVGAIAGKKRRMPAVKLEKRILDDCIPFDVSANHLFTHDEVLGYNPWLGWLFGVANIMTDTVTTQNMRSFMVRQPGGGALQPVVDERVSTVLHVFLPVVLRTEQNKTAMLAAVVREAEALKVSKAPAKDVSQMLRRVMEAEERHQSLIDKSEQVLHTFSSKLPDIFASIAKQTLATSFLNQLITAVHAVMYDPEEDGEIDWYVIRTNHILTLSNALSAMANSLPALITKDVQKLDFAGIITTLLSLFSSTRFWIEVKTSYLVSTYKKEIDVQMDRINQYFSVVSTKKSASAPAVILPPLDPAK